MAFAREHQAEFPLELKRAEARAPERGVHAASTAGHEEEEA